MKKYYLILSLFLFSSCEKEPIAEPIRSKTPVEAKDVLCFCKIIGFDAEVKEWSEIRSIFYKIAMKHNLDYKDNSVTNTLHPELNVEIPTSSSSHFSIKLSSYAYMGKKSRVSLYITKYGSDNCGMFKSVFEEAKEEYSQSWSVVEVFSAGKI